MSSQPADSVSFSDLSRNPRAVAERARRLGRLRVTHRDSADFYLTTADQEEERDENLMTAARLFGALFARPGRCASGGLCRGRGLPLGAAPLGSRAFGVCVRTGRRTF